MIMNTEEGRTRYRIGQAIRHLLRLAPAVNARLAEELGVGTTDLLALDHATSAANALGVVELADLLNIRSASATVLVDRLVERGHLERRPHAGDRRRIDLTLTATAHQEVRLALDPLIAGITRATAQLDPAQSSVVAEFLAQIIAVLEHFTETPAHAAPRVPPDH